ncbi:MAG: N-6 DNA methylase [Limnochordia bacterium]|nr:N-6 DNA methylase [Limnochordia bacterium]MDD4518297.1 N-6 DNA methylase [Limnochordia bacterium]
MDKREYGALKEVNYAEVASNIMDPLRDTLKPADMMLYQVGLSTLAIILKERQSSSSLLHCLESHVRDETTLVFLRKLLKENYDQIEALSKLDIEILKAATLLAQPKSFTDTSVMSTPEGISALAISLLDLKEDDTILDLGSGVGSFLTQAAYASGSKNLYGVEINTHNVIITNLRRLVAELPIKVVQGNILSQDYGYLSANKVFSNYPLGVRLSNLQHYLDKNSALKEYFKDTKRTVSGDWVFGLAAYLNTRQPGRTVILMTNTGTWNKPDEQLRKSLVENGVVEGVVLLPAGLLSCTGISLTMLVLSQNNTEIRMVDALDIYTEGRRQNSLEPTNVEKIVNAYYNDTDISRKVTASEIAEQEYILNPQRYIDIDVGITDGISLGKLCLSISRGAMIRSGELDNLMSAEETNYRYLMLQDIQDGTISPNLLSLIGVEERYRRHCINDRDLVVSKIAPFKVAMAHIKEGQTILASGNLYFIKLDETKVNPVFVEVFLQSEAGMAQLNRLAKGSAVRNISIQDLKRIQIPNIPKTQQDLIAEEYENLCDELIVLQKQADITRDKKAKLVEGVL